jgi:hypothetical protein
MIRKHFKFRRRLFVGLVFAALAAPAAAQAQSGVFVDGGPVPVSNTTISSYQPSYLRYHEVGGPVAQGPLARSERSQTVATITPLQADGLRWQAMAAAYERNQPSVAISERSNGVQGPDPSLVPQLATTTSTGFDWTDAGVGASTVFGTALLLGIALLFTRRHQHSGLTSA